MSAILLGVCAVVTVGLANAEPPKRSISTSRQFIVYGTDARLRGAICDLAERAKQAALQVLGERDAWKTPIVVNAQLAQANRPELPRAQLAFSQTGFGFKLQLDLSIDAEVNAPAIEREFLRAIFLEMIYRAVPATPVGTAFVEPPDWLLDGTLAVAPSRDAARLADALSAPATSGNVMSLEEFLRRRPELLESPSRVLYRAYSAALISKLTETTDGRRRLAHFVFDLPRASNDPVAELRANFPILGETPEQMQKQWLTAVARMAAPERYRLLNCEETERELVRMLRVEFQARDQSRATYSLEEFPKFVRLPASAGALNRLRQELLLLSARANPLYRPVLAEYEKLAGLLARGKTRRISERLAELRATREHLSRRMSAIADYLNWFEVTQARGSSGLFRDYMKAAELPAEREYRRRDAISVYLDALETQF